jgi:hypothetical protein
MGSLRHNKYFSGFDPRDVPGCQLWLDAADSSTFTLSGSNITTWNDKSGMGRNAVQYNTGFATYDSTQKRVVITTTGQLAAPVAAGTFSTGVSCFVVFQKYGANTTYDTIVARTSGAYPAPFDFYYTSTTMARLVGNGGLNYRNFDNSSTIPRLTTTTLYYFNIPGNVSWSESTNGTTPSSVTATATFGIPAYGDVGTQIYIGTRGDKTTTANVYIYEIVFYSGSLTTSQRQQVEGHLSWKWGLIPRFQNPTSVSGLSLWFDAADPSTLTLSGSNVTRWRDKVSNIQATPTSTVTIGTFNSNPIIRIPAGSEMSFTASFSGQSRSWFMVMRNDTQLSPSIVPFGLIHGYDTGDEQLTIVHGSPYIFYHNVGGLTGVASANTTNPFNILQIYTAIASSVSTSSNVIAIAGSPLTLLTNNLASGMATTQIFRMSRADFNSAVTVCEVIAYNTALTTAQRQQIEGYLADKWGLRASLPSTFTLFPTSHPFYRSLPYTRAFNPLDIGGCSLWLDGADAGSMVLSGSNVAAWLDKSGNTRHATRASPNQPVYDSNSSSIVFNGTSAYMDLSDAFNMLSSTGKFYTAFIVERRNGAGGGFPINGGPSAGSALIVGYTGDTTWRHTYAVVSDLDYTVPGWANPDPVRVWSAGYNGAIRDTYLNGTLGSSAAFTTALTGWTQPTLGLLTLFSLNVCYVGQLYEILFYNSYLSTSDRQQVENYLAWKWGVSAQIASPTEIAGCQLWLDGRDPNGNGILPSAGATVTTWVDKSGSGNSMTASGTPTFQISPSRISLNGSSYLQKLSSLSNAVYTSFYVYQQTSSSGPLFTTNATLSYTGLFANEGGTAYVCRSDSSWFTKTNAIPNNQINLLTVQYDASGNIYVWLNGVLNIQTTTAGAITRDRLTLGVRLFNNQYMTGSYYEVIQMNSALATAQRQQIEKYLTRKWNIQGTSNTPPRTTAFAPPQLSDLALWLDAADSAQVTLSGSNVTAWGDKSSNALSLQSGARPTYVTNSLNGLPVVSFTTTQNLSSTTTMTLSPSNTWAFVFNSPTGGNFFMAEHSSNINNVQGSYFLGANFDLYAMNRTGVLSTWKRYQDTIGQGVPPFSSNTWYIAIVSDNNTNGGVFFRRNGSARTVSNVNSFTSLTGDITSNFFINHRLSADVNIAELMVYNRGLSLAEVQTLEGYLASKWGLLSSLPSSHPYVKIAP